MQCMFLCICSCSLYCFLYWAFLGVACVALEVAANLNVTSEQLLDYSNDHGRQRQTLEIVAAILWCMLLLLDLSDVFRYVPCLLSYCANGQTYCHALFALWLTLRWYGQWSKGIDACMPLIPNSFQIWAVLPEVVWSLPQDCWPLVFHCLVCVASLWPQQPVGSGFALCHVCCTKSNGSFYCMEVSTLYHFNNAMINGRYCANVWEESLANVYFTWQWLNC